MKLGPYEVLDRIGEGGVGTVYRARAAGGRDVAVKVLKRRDEATVARFDRERRLQGALGEEEGFVPLLDRGDSPEGPYLVMPFVPGGTLRARLARGPLAIDATVALGRALATALGQAHARGIAHRDMKPENVLFAADGTPLVADLGLAKHFLAAGSPEESFSVSRTGAFSGTVGYSAPEQVRNAKSVGPQADIFALGAILHECLSGEPAFGGATFLDVLRKVSEGTAPSLREKRPDAPSWLVQIVEKALARAPQHRFANGVALLQALEGEDWGPPKRAPSRLPFVVRRPPPPSADDLEVPPSTAVRTENLDLAPTVRDAGDLVFTSRPADAPATVRVPEIPFVVGSTEIPSTIRKADSTVVSVPPPPAPAPAAVGRWLWVALCLVGLAAIALASWLQRF
jgi:serine/threonine-protein kinase